MPDLDLATDLAARLDDSGHCTHHPPLHRSDSPEDAALWWDSFQLCKKTARHQHLRWMAEHDLFFLLVYILNRKHFIRNHRSALWTWDRCNDVQELPNGNADLWPRESYKSEVVTFGLTIFDIINDPEVTFGIFSHTRPMAASFLGIIKRELENNELLKGLFPEIFWSSPKTEARWRSVPWSDHAITIKRKGNPKEATVEAWGLVDGQPTGRRFGTIVYDDVTAREQVTQEMVDKTTVALENSFLLTASDPPRYRYVATYQEIGDTTQIAIDRNLFRLRQRGPFNPDGSVAYCSDEKFAEYKRLLSHKVFALQVLLDPTKAKDPNEVGFKDEWWTTYVEAPPRRMLNIYGLVDPAGDSTESNSRFALFIVGLGADKVIRVLDMVWDKLDLEERWRAIFEAEQRWEPLRWAYEKFAYQSDLEHYRYRMNEVHYDFRSKIIAVGGTHRSKDQRIGDLIPFFKEKRLQFPRSMKRRLKDGTEVDLVKQFKEREYGLWPYNKRQRDMLDALARIADPSLSVIFPRAYGGAGVTSRGSGGYGSESSDGGSWMSQ